MTFLLVLNSGHMVPLDQPRFALDMLRRFLRGEPFSDSQQSSLEVGSCSGEHALDCSGPPDCRPSSNPSAPGAALSGHVSPGELLSLQQPTPPRIVGTPTVGQDSATVAFTYAARGEGGEGGEGEGEVAAAAAAVSFEARSSPDDILGVGPASPVLVEGLTPGRTYTFTVTAVKSAASASAAVGGAAAGAAGAGAGQGGEEEDATVLLRSRPSVGSPAVTPGCGQGSAQKPCSGHGVCREGGEDGVCLCENGYAGDRCEVLAGGGVRGGGGGSFVAPGATVGIAAAEHAGDIKLMVEADIPVLQSSAKVCSPPVVGVVPYPLPAGRGGETARNVWRSVDTCRAVKD